MLERPVMKLFLRHHLFRILTLSRFLSSSGAYIYNLVFIVYAASLPFKNIAVFMANMITILPFRLKNENCQNLKPILKSFI